MIIKDIPLNIDYVKLGLTIPEMDATLTAYNLESEFEFCNARKRRAVLVLPGGGYSLTSPREAEPIALQFLAADISVFVLNYSCAPSRFPIALVQVAQSLKIMRENAEELNLLPDKLVVCGFSAGGHLASCIGTLWKEFLPKYGFTDETHKPNGIILSYPVISGVHSSHVRSFMNLLGDNPSPKDLEFLSTENRVSKDTPPTFLWHTFEDKSVLVQNSLMFASALAKEGVPFELHVYPKGGHGLSLANNIVCQPEGCIERTADWINKAIAWVCEL